MSTLAPHQQRVVTERDELAERLAKLFAFFQSPIFAGLPAAEQTRLRSQARFMDGYLAVLGERIEAFSAPVVTSDMVAAERERCAALARNKALHCDDHGNHYGANAARDIEDAIRGPNV